MLFAGAITRQVGLGYTLEMLSITGEHATLIVHTSEQAQEKLRESVQSGVRLVVGGWLERDALLDAYRSADVLLSVGERGGRQLSSKIFEYMSVGKPILHVCTGSSDANIPYLKRYPLSLCIVQDECSIEENARLVALFMAWSKGRRVIFDETVAQLSDCTPAAVCEKLQSR